MKENMHCSHMEDAVQAFVDMGMLIVEGRLLAEGTDRGYREGPHCPPAASHANLHQCNLGDFLCMRAERLRKHMSLLGNNALQMSIEVLLCPPCQCGTSRARNLEVAIVPSTSDLLLEQWNISINYVSGKPCNMSVRGLLQAVRSQLHFSQLSAWWSSSKGTCPFNVCYRIVMAEEAFASSFSKTPHQHVFPPAAVCQNRKLKVLVKTLPRCEIFPNIKCAACSPETIARKRSTGLEQPLLGESLLDLPGPSSSARAGCSSIWHLQLPPSPPRRRKLLCRRTDGKHNGSTFHIMPLSELLPEILPSACTHHGKHDCQWEEDVDELQPKHLKQSVATTNRVNLDLNKKEVEEVLTVLRIELPDSASNKVITDKEDLQTYTASIFKTGQCTSNFDPASSTKNIDLQCGRSHSNTSKKLPQYTRHLHHHETTENLKATTCPNVIEFKNPVKHPINNKNTLSKPKDPENNPVNVIANDELHQRTIEVITDKLQHVSLHHEPQKGDISLQISSGKGVPSAHDKAKFRQSLDSAASIFHWRTGLPLTSSPAPLRRAFQRFDFDSSLNSVKAIRSALFDGDDQPSYQCIHKNISSKGEQCTVHYQSPGSALLGSFEESVLNGRLEPVSTVHGFTADLGASGAFCPPHLNLPVTVFFYTVGDIDKVSSPYLAHINLGKKGYVVPRTGTIQVTLLNPLGTVIKMFVVMYDLTDMPTNSHTFLRQRTLYMPNCISEPVDNSQKYLRYLIHLRFASSKSGRLSLHTDIRMIIFRKSDMDTATNVLDMAYELRSFTYAPTNPKFSPRK